MKEFLGVETIPKTQIDYPSSDNPRIEGLNAEDPKIQGLAKSIKSEGLLYPPILRVKADKRFDPIDGDRRLIAYFDVLGNTEVKASVFKVDDIAEIRYMRLAANWDREDFSALEKGSYLWDILVHELGMNYPDIAEGKSTVEDYWSQRSIRGEYLMRLSNSLAKPKSTIARYINVWLGVPEKFRSRVAKSRDDLISGKIAPSKAVKVDLIGRKVKAPEKVWEEFVPKNKPAIVTHKELELINKAIRVGQVKTFSQVKEFREEKVPEWTETTFLLKKEEEQLAAKLASNLNTEISKVYRGGVRLAAEHFEELTNVVKEL